MLPGSQILLFVRVLVLISRLCIKFAEDVDFTALPTEHRVLKITTSEGIQRRCIFYEILDDSEIEGDEYFTVRLSSSNPQVIVTNEATVTIVDDDVVKTTEPITTTTSSPPTTTMNVPTTTDPTEGICLISCTYRCIYNDCRVQVH